MSDCRVSPGRSRPGSENAHFSRSRVDASARSSSSNSCVRLTLFVQLVRIRNRTMSETISSGGRFPLYSPGEVVAFPDVGPAVAAGVLVRAPLKAVRLAGRVRLGRCRLVEQTAQVDEVLLRRRALLQRRDPPLRDEGVRRHGVYASTTSLSGFAMRALTTCLAGISTRAPVAGFRPMRVVCGRGRNPTLRSSTCSAGVEVAVLRFRWRGPSRPARATDPAARRTCRASPA